jgi:hypothetical protein
VRSAAFDADVWFVAVSICMSVLLTSCTLDDICFIGVWRFYSYNSVLKTCYVVDFFSNIPGTKSHVHFLSFGSFIQGIRPGPRLLVVFCNKLIFYSEELLAPRPTPKLEDHPVGCPRLLIQQIRSYPQKLEGVSSICNLRMRHAVVTRDAVLRNIFPNSSRMQSWSLSVTLSSG